jgi:Na+/H+-dicarboxylate symporter
MNLRTLALKVAVVVSAVTLQAHPGHAPFSEGAKHFVTSPSHFVPALIFAALLGVAAQLLKSRGERNFVRVIAALVAAAAIIG